MSGLPSIFPSQQRNRSSPGQDTAPTTQPITSQPAEIQATTASIYSGSRHEDYEVPDNPSLDTISSTLGFDNQGEDVLPLPSFRPLFTLITDPSTNETVHAEVYYVFSDDAENEREGHDAATIASLRALDQLARKSHSALSKSAKEMETEDERFILLDLERSNQSDGHFLRVRNATSLSPSWAITSATLRPAPTFGEELDDDGTALMVLLEGLELQDRGNSDMRTDNIHRSKQGQEKKAAELLQEARKRGGGIVHGMDELWRGLHQGIRVLENITGPDLDDQILNPTENT